MKFINQNISRLAIFLLVAGGCNKFVEIPSPTTELVTASVFNNNASATSAMTGIYTQMFNNEESFYISASDGLLSDELTNYSTSDMQVRFYTNSMIALKNPGEWTNAYSYIYQANAIIAAVKNNHALTPAVIAQLSGEAEFIRAFWNFYLTNSYGDIPLVNTTSYSVNASLSRTPKSQVFQSIISDLKDAENLLNSNYIDGSDTTITTDRVRPNKAVAAALLARIYLYSGDYPDAIIQSTSVINNSSLYSLDSLNNVLLVNSSEAIWQLSTPLPSDNYNTWDGFNYILMAAPNVSVQTNTISPQLLASFEPGDLRYTNWIDSISFPGQTYYFPYKYKVSQSDQITEYTMVLRLAEQYLIRAEAEAQTNDLAGAASDLNIIRTRAGLSNTAAVTQSDLLRAILHERQVEMFTEWGARWNDLIRTGNINSVMGTPGNVTAMKGGIWSATDSLYPIPQNDRNIDPNLSQNAGY